MVRESVRFIISIVPVDRNSLPKDPEILQQMLVDLTTQLVDLITAQRDYQANAQTIKTQQTVDQTLFQL